MTANQIDKLPPELLRKGRLDDIFFVDLPGHDVRKEIFTIHISKCRGEGRGRDPEQFDLDRLAEVSVDFSGAEIEEAVISAMYDAYYDHGREYTTGDIVSAVGATTPLVQTMEEKIQSLRKWAKTRARLATSRERSVLADPAKADRFDNLR